MARCPAGAPLWGARPHVDRGRPQAPASAASASPAATRPPPSPAGTSYLQCGPRDLGAIEELAESLHVEDADAQKLLVKLVTERCSSGLLQATADLRGSDQPAAATELGRVLKFAGLAPEVAEGGVALPSISAAEKQELFLLYQANSLTAGEADASKAESIALLKEVLGLQGDNTVE